jgi:hypothetical protein
MRLFVDELAPLDETARRLGVTRTDLVRALLFRSRAYTDRQWRDALAGSGAA